MGKRSQYLKSLLDAIRHLDFRSGYVTLRLLFAPVSPSATWLDGELLSAAEQERPGLIRLLLAHGASPDAADAMGWTALHYAARYGPALSVQLLLDSGANPNSCELCGRTPVFFARKPQVLQALLDGGAGADVADNEGHWAYAYGLERAYPTGVLAVWLKIPTVRAHVREPINGVAIVSVYTRCPLGKVPDRLKRARLKRLKLLVEAGANPNAVIGDWRCCGSAFSHVCAQNDEGAVQYLLDHGANPNVADSHGITPLARVAEKNYFRIVRLLLEHGANANVRDRFGRSPLDVCRATSTSFALIEPHYTLGSPRLPSMEQVLGLINELGKNDGWTLDAGCSEEEITALEEVCGVSLPEVYKEFLRALGKDEHWCEERAVFKYSYVLRQNKRFTNAEPQTHRDVIVGVEWMSAQYVITPDDSDGLPVFQVSGHNGEKREQVARSIWELALDLVIEQYE